MAGIGVALALVLALLAGAGALFSGRPLALPVWAVVVAEDRLNHALAGHSVMTIGGIEVVFSPHRRPELRLRDLRLSPPAGSGHIRLPEVNARFSRSALLRGRIEPRMVRMSGAHIVLRREADGQIDFDFGDGGAAPGSFGELLERIDEFLAQPFLATMHEISAEAVTLTLNDHRADRVWTIADGHAVIARTATETVLDIGMGMQGASPDPATAQLTFGIRHDGEGVRLSARIAGVAAPDIAAQSPLLAWLGLLDAPIAGDLRAGLDGEGRVVALDGSLDIGAGAFSPAEGARPLPIHGAGITFAYDEPTGRFRASRLAVDSPTLRLQGTAHADLIAAPAGDTAPAGYLAQLRLDGVAVDPAGIFAAPVRFDQGALDMRLRLDPFAVEIGQLALVAADSHLHARGRVGADESGWDVALDIALDRITHDRLLALWPLALVPRTRDWLVANVQQGRLSNVHAGLRLQPGAAPQLALGYDFSGADVRYMPTLPPIQGGRGYAVLENQSYMMMVEHGHATPPEGGRIAVQRSVFRVPDVTQKPTPAEITLQTDSTITAALSLLDQPPFGFLSRAGMPVDLGTGRAQLLTELRLPLKAQLTPQEVDFTITGTLADLRSERLAPGRVLAAPALQLQADPQGVTIAGPGQLGAARFDARWHLPLGTPGGGASTVSGTVALDPGFAREFLTGLGADPISGAANGRIHIDLPRGRPPEFTLSSDLVGAGVRLAPLGWSKAAKAAGKLEIAGTLSTPPQLSKLALSGPGLQASGNLVLARDGGIERLTLAPLKLGNWLDARVELTGAGPGRPPVPRITGGRLDLRQMIGGQPPGAGGSLQSTPLEVALDRVQISDSLALTGVQARIAAGRGGIDGTFRGLLNGQAPVTGRMVPGTRGTAFHVTADDAGQALTAAGIFARGHGGKAELTLNPAAAPGHYDGTVTMRNVRVRNMPVLAELLNAISIVGLIEQLSTSGLLFGEAGARLRLTPAGIELREGYAVGASFGVSLEGVYLKAGDRLDMQGVISPFYLLNAVGSVLTRRGEGLMGLNYRIGGTSAAPAVSVNPLSVLAPAFMRDILRRPAARMGE